MKNSIFSRPNLLVALLFFIALMQSFSPALLAQEQRNYIIYEVQANETVYSIARKNGLKEQDIYRLNPSSEQGINIGQKLKIPTKNAALPNTIDQSEPSHLGTHTVVAGETLFAVARKYNISPALLKQYNPDIDPDVLSPGMVLRIALPGGTPINSEANRIVVVSSERTNNVKVSLLLPFTPDGGPGRYVRFYEGFLMGIYRLKKAGISVELNVFSTPTINDLKPLIASGELIGSDVIIGGHSETEVSTLARYSGERGIVYVSPFIATESRNGDFSAGTFRLNTSQQDLYPFLASAYCAKYKGYKTIFVRTEKGNHIPVVSQIKTALSHASMPYDELPLAELTREKLHQYFKAGKVVLMTDDGSKETLQEVLDRLEKHQGSSSSLTIFGYPQWQSYGRELLGKLGQYKGTIYSSFFFDEELKESQSFEKNYNAWYGKAIDRTYPKYSLLGYDTSRYFLRALAAYGPAFSNALAEIPSDGLQNDFLFRRLDGDNSYCSVNLFFITYDAQGNAVRTKVVF